MSSKANMAVAQAGGPTAAINATLCGVIMGALEEGVNIYGAENGIKGYIQEALYNEDALRGMLENFPMENTEISFEAVPQEDKDWNEEWEKNFFQPIILDNRCVIHSTFHKNVPQAEYDILINPQMAFGTGHHETTSLILGELLDADLQGKSLLDMGCGTSILAILAAMRGAGPITAIDIDDWCVSNSKDNIQLNHITNITVELGDASSLKGRSPFDIIIANINRNILIADMSAFAIHIKPGGVLILSGFYESDVTMLTRSATENGLVLHDVITDEEWASASFRMK